MEETAVVVVKSVDKGSAAGGRLAPGDRILGIDGSLLTTDAPLADLAARWKKSRNRAGPTLRIQRGESFADVTVPKSQATERVPRRRIDPAGAVREIAALGRALEFASYAVDVSHTAHYSARVSLRFRSGQVTKANAKLCRRGHCPLGSIGDSVLAISAHVRISYYTRFDKSLARLACI